MPQRSNDQNWDELRNRIIGLGDQSSHKTYFSELKARLRELEEARHSLAESNAYFQAVMDAATEVAVIATTADGVITLFNSGAENLLGYGADELVGQKTPLTFHTDEEVARRGWDLTALYGHNVSGLQVLVEPAEREGAEKREWTLVRRDGRRVFAETVVTAMRGAHGEIAGYLLVSQDITQRKAAEEELSRYREQLEQLVEERTAELRRAIQAAEAANRAKGTFLANMSHEIRTPMNAIMGMIHLALNSPLNPKQQEYLGKASFAAESLLGIINDILDFSKIEAGKLDLECCDFLLEEMLERVSSIISTKAMEKGIEFLIKLDPGVPPSLSGDPLRLGQVLINLCNNAVKFTQIGEIVLDICAVAPAEGGKIPLRFSVRDTGIGINATQMARLFHPFSQADSTSTRKYGGTGLGLAISRQLVELMGGEIGAESEPGKGSRFYFTLAMGVGALQPQRSLDNATELRGLRMMVVDDSSNARAVFQDLLGSLGYQVTLTSCVSEALRELETAGEHPYDLLFMDWRMPEMDGFEATALIRGRPGAAPKIVMVTAFGNEEVQQRCREEGLDGYLTKPITVSSLFDAVMSAFGREGGERTVFSRAPTPKVANARLRGARVLLVEDNDFNQLVAAELLREVGVQVTVADNGEEALDVVRRGRFDAVLMDLQMPVMDGLEATRRMRSDARLTQVPVIAMTAHAMVKDRERCLAAGMNDYLSKPINPQELYEVLGRWLAPEKGRDVAERSAKSESTRELPAALPGISVEEGLKHLNNKKGFYLRMLEKFLETKRDSAGEIRRELESGDRETAARSAHSIKSIAGTIGADGLMAAAAALEKGIDSGDGAAVEPLLEDYRQSLDEIVAGLAQLFEEKEPKEEPKEEEAPRGEVDTEELKSLLDRMIALLRSDVGQAMALLEPLGALCAGAGGENAFREIRGLMDRFELDEARSALVKLRAEIGGT